RNPDLVFNLIEVFGKDLRGDIHIASLYELLNLPYTGSGPGALYLQNDKALSKKIFAAEKILYPDYAVFSRNADLEMSGNFRMPVFVKPLRSDASIGIDGNSLVDSSIDMMKKVVAIHDKFQDAALVEQYIEGREFYVGVIGNQELEAF